ncbi:MAG: HD domain-containing phosphohydrolase [Nitrospirota bacterium]
MTEKLIKLLTSRKNISFLLIITVMTIPVIIFSFISIKSHTKAFKNNLSGTNLSIIRIISENIRSNIEGFVKVQGACAKKPAVIRAFRDGDATLLKREIRPMLELKKCLMRIFVVDNDGNVIAEAVTRNMRGLKGDNISGLEWFRQARNEIKPYISGVYRSEKDAMDLFVSAVPILKNGRKIGMIAGDHNVAYAFDSVRKMNCPANSFIVLVDGKGKVITANIPDKNIPTGIFYNCDSVSKVIKGEEGCMEECGEGREHVMVSAFAPVKDTGWGVILEQPFDQAFMPVKDYNIRIISVGGIVLAVSWMLAFAGAHLYERNRRLVRELRESERNLEGKVKERTEELYKLLETIEIAKREWEMTFDSLNDLIYVHDRDFRIVRCNIVFKEYVRLEYEDIIGKEYYRIFPRSDGPLSLCKRALETHLEYAEEIVDEERDRTFLIGYYPIFDKAGKHVYSVHSARDITERKKSELRIKEEAEVSRSLLRIFEVISTSLDEGELINNVISIAPKYLKFDRIGVFLYDDELNGYILVKVHGLGQLEENLLKARVFREDDINVISLIKGGMPALIEDARQGDLIPAELVNRLNIGCAVIVPILLRDRMAGAIYGDYTTVKPIEQKEVELMKGLSDGLGIALQNSRLYRESLERLAEISRKMEIIATMNQIDRSILSTVEIFEILDSTVKIINRVIPCERATILLLDGDVYKVLAEWGIGNLNSAAYSAKISHLNYIEETRSPMYIPDLMEDKRPCAYHEDQKSIGIRSSLIIPLISKNSIIGILDLGSTYSERFTPEHITTAESIADQIAVGIENAKLYEDLENLLVSTIKSLASAIDAKSPWTKGHSERVTNYALAIGRKINLDEKNLEALKLGGLLHDIGKLGTYDVVLDKPGRLTDEEFALVKKHPGRGAEIIEPIKPLRHLIPIIKYHHERIDGRGYPEGLKGDEIPLLTKILCVADSFDSMTADRPYRPAPGKEYAISELKRCAGTQFDQKVVEAFLEVLEETG